MNYQIILILVASIMLILLLSFVGYTLYEHRKDQVFPPIIQKCPDNWNLSEKECINTVHLGINNTPASKDFSSMTDCDKSRWAKEHGLTWQGYTNNDNICDGLYDYLLN